MFLDPSRVQGFSRGILEKVLEDLVGSRGVLVIPLDIPLMTDFLLWYYSGKNRVSETEMNINICFLRTGRNVRSGGPEEVIQGE